MERVILDREGNKLKIGTEIIAARGSWTCRGWIYQIKEDKVLFTCSKLVPGVKPAFAGYSFLEKKIKSYDGKDIKPNTFIAGTIIKTIKDD